MTSQTLKYACIQIVAALLVLVSLALFAHRLPNFQDIGVYERIGQTAHTAGTIDSEYPPLTSAFFSVLTLGTSVGLPFEITWPVFVALMLIATLAWISKVNGLRVGAWSAVGILSTMILLSPEMLFSKYDSIIGLLLLVTLTMRNKGWFRLAALFLILAASFKLVPLLLWPLLFFSTPPAHRKEIWMGTLIGCVEFGKKYYPSAELSRRSRDSGRKHVVRISSALCASPWTKSGYRICRDVCAEYEFEWISRLFCRTLCSCRSCIHQLAWTLD
jgi:hypothetical protein